MPKGLISASLLVCERVLNEGDGSISIIRIADIYHVRRIPNVPPEMTPVIVRAVGIAKFESEDEGDHVAGLRLIRPDGESKDLEPQNPFDFRNAKEKSQIPNSPRGFNLIAEIPIIPKHVGPHSLHLIIDGQDVASFPFTLVETTAGQA